MARRGAAAEGQEGRGGKEEAKGSRGGSPSFGFPGPLKVCATGETKMESPTSLLAKNHQLPAPTFHEDGTFSHQGEMSGLVD